MHIFLYFTYVHAVNMWNLSLNYSILALAKDIQTIDI